MDEEYDVSFSLEGKEYEGKVTIPDANKNLTEDEKINSTCTVENPHIINSIYFRSIIKENDFNGKDQDRIYSNNYHSRW